MAKVEDMPIKELDEKKKFELSKARTCRSIYEQISASGPRVKSMAETLQLVNLGTPKIPLACST